MKSVDSGSISERVLSIDVLRGFDMFWIIGGSILFKNLSGLIGYPYSQQIERQFEHSAWNGFTFEDLIFPLFLFIVGMVMPYSLTKRLERGESRKSIFNHVVSRTILLFLLGLIFNDLLGLRFADMRYAGVLQRIALCYFITALIVMNSKTRGQIIWFTGILFFYFLIMELVPVPGIGAGALTPEGNLASFIDREFLPGSFCCFEFGDNEGILSTIPAVSTTLLGVLSGHWLRHNSDRSKKALLLLIAGVVSIILSLLWNTVFPINKLLWTSSYVLLAGGFSMILAAVFYWIIDVKGYRRWSFPFMVIGLNPITIYMAQRFIGFDDIADFFVHGFAEYFGDLKPVFIVISVITVKWIFLYFLYRQKIFLKT